MKYIFSLLFVVSLFSCVEDDKVAATIAAIPMDVEVVRFDQEFANVTAETLPELKLKYPVFFPKQFHDSIWLYRISDTLQQELNTEVAAVFPSEEKIKPQLESLFQHIAYYFPEFVKPTVLTTTTDVDYQNKAIVANDLLVLSIDTYLGADHKFYEGIPAYLNKNLNPSQIAPDVAEAYAKQLVSPPKDRTLLSQMIFYGKILYLKDLWLPEVSDAEKIGYTNDEFAWAVDNEEYMWRYFVEKELLFSTNDKLPARFIYPAPFSKFFLEIDNESPGRVGIYVGWQMIRSYMEKNDISINKLLVQDANTIFAASKYKPAKK